MNSIKEIERQFNSVILPAQIRGNRWSCTALSEKPLPLVQPFRIRISRNAGFIIYSSTMLDEKERNELDTVLREWSTVK